jgi:hypothetical protein
VRHVLGQIEDWQGDVQAMETKEMTKPAWLEDWSGTEEDAECDVCCPWLVVDVPDKLFIDASNPERAKLAAAAPRMLRMLLESEWVKDGDGQMCCWSCEYGAYGDEQEPEHGPSCELDVLLTELGFPDAASRTAAREAIKREFP